MNERKDEERLRRLIVTAVSPNELACWERKVEANDLTAAERKRLAKEIRTREAFLRSGTCDRDKSRQRLRT